MNIFACLAIVVGFECPEYTFLEEDTSVYVMKSAKSDFSFTVEVSAGMFVSMLSMTVQMHRQ